VKRLLVLLLLIPWYTSGFAGPVGFESHSGAAVPGALAFREDGPVRMGDYFGRGPVVLVLGYLGCVNLCSTTWQGAAEALEATGLRADSDYVAIFMSIDPRDETAPARHRAGWHVLTGARSAAVVADKVGFQYEYDADSGQYAHPAGFVVLDPVGAVSAYFGGVRFDSKALGAALRSASRGETPGVLETVLLVCFHDPVNGRYSDTVLVSLRVAIFVFLAGIGWLAWRRL